MHPTFDQDTLAARLAFLRQVPLFANLGDHDLLALSQHLRPREYPKGQMIFCQGDSSRDLYVVMKGKVRIFRAAPSGHETSINIFSVGDVIGEFATIDQQPRSATAQAIERCVLLQMEGETFLRYMREMPDLALGLARLLVSKVRWTAAYAETIAQYDAAGRLLHILLLYNEQFGQELEAGKRYLLDLSLNQADLATLVGVRREWLNRILQDWYRQGLLEYDAGKIVILDLPRMEQERDSRIEANVGHTDW